MPSTPSFWYRLDAASLATVKEWFIDKYGPNNALLVLAGDINAAEARPLVEKYFGAIKRGPVNNPAQADVPKVRYRECRNRCRDVIELYSDESDDKIRDAVAAAKAMLEKLPKQGGD